jgi:hypothetical protein
VSSLAAQADDLPREILGANRQVQLAVGDRQAEGDAPFEPGDERAHQRAIDRIQLQRLGVMNLRAGQPAQELRRVLVRVDGDARGGLRRLVQPRVQMLL